MTRYEDADYRCAARQRRDLSLAGDLYRQTCARFEILGNHYGVALSLNGLGDVARLQGDPVRAAGQYRRALAILDGLRSTDDLFPRLNLALVDLSKQRFSVAEGALARFGKAWSGSAGAACSPAST